MFYKAGMKQQLLECIPNISEGNDVEKINAIAHSVTTVKGIRLLNIDIGKAANRNRYYFCWRA